METKNDQPEIPGWGKRKTYRKVRVKENQLIWIVYEKPNGQGHIETATDAFRNILGRVIERYDEEQRQFEYSFIGADGTVLYKSDNLEKLKQQISKDKEMLFKQAYEKRLEKIKVMRQQKGQDMIMEKKPKYPPVPGGIVDKEKKYQARKREQEMKELREEKAKQIEQTQEIGR